MNGRGHRLFVLLILSLWYLSARLHALPPSPRDKISPQEKLDRKKQKQQERADAISRARYLVSQGQILEDGGDLFRARNSYEDAEDIFHTKEGRTALKKIRKTITRSVDVRVEGAHADYIAKRYPQAQTKLKEAQRIDPSNKLLCYDMAIVLRDDGNRPAAVDALDRCLELIPEGKERDLWEQFRATLVTPEDSSGIPNLIVPEIDSVNRSLQTTDSGYYHATDASVGREACPLLMKLKEFPSLPSLVFDRARCQEMMTNQEQEAIQSMQDYLRLAVGALDLQEEQAHLRTLRSLSTLSGSAGDEVRARFAEATRYLSIGRYDLVINELVAADSDVPNYSGSSKALALLYRDFGDIDSACRYLGEYLEKEPLDSEDRREMIDLFRPLKYRRIQYDQAIDDASVPLSEVLQAYLSFGRHTGKHFVRERMDRVIDDLDQALQIFPRGIEANDLLAVVNQLTDNPRLAKRSYDILWSQRQPVTFFTATKDRIEIWPDVLRISRYPQMSDPFRELGRTKNPESEQLARREEIQFVETKESSIVVHLRSSAVEIRPARLVLPPTGKGPLARKYTNQYTKLFQRYLGVDTIKIGKEGLTSKEIVRIGFDLLALANSFYGLSSAYRITAISNLLNYGRDTIWIASVANDVKGLLEQRQRVSQYAGLKRLPLPTANFAFKTPH